MRRQLRGRLRDLVAAIALAVLAIAACLVILAEQKASLPSWVPILGQSTFDLRAQFSSAQAVTPGQGQAIDIAGVQVGKVSSVDLENGRAVVGMSIEPKYAGLIHPTATLLLRPKTGLNDMVIELDPGPGTGEVKRGSTIPLAQTQPNVTPDQILASLDADTQDYLGLLLSAGGQGLRGAGGIELSAGLRRFEPTARDLARLNGALATRRTNLRHVIHNFRALMEALGNRDTQLGRFVDSSNSVLGDFASQQASIRTSLSELPATLRTTSGALASANQLSIQLRPTLEGLIPQAEALTPALGATQRFFRQTVGPIRRQIRPFTREVRPTVKTLSETGPPLEKTATGLNGAFSALNYGLNELAYNPPGPNNEGFLFFASWLNHDLNSIYSLQDAGGPVRRAVTLLSCNASTLSYTFAQSRPFIMTALQLANIPKPAEIC